MKDFWNERYRNEQYAYGVIPNVYFKNQLAKYKPGRILMPAEGEGRNAVYAATLGWDVVAVDQSEEGRKKAEKLAKQHNVTIDYKVGEFSDFNFQEESFDAIGLIYAHFTPDKKSTYHILLSEYLKTGRIIILEAFSKEHLKVSADNKIPSGPKNLEMLYSQDEIIQDFPNFECVELIQKEVELKEGLYHIGRSSVIRFLGKKM